MIDLFSRGTSAEIIDLVTSVMAHPDDLSEENKIWAFKAIEFIEALVPVMVWKRENQSFFLDAQSLFGAMAFRNIIDLTNSISIPADIILPLKTYIENLHGFSQITTYEETDENFFVVKQQHFYRAMQFLKPLTYLNGGDELPFRF